MNTARVGVDIGGTKCLVAVLDPAGEVLHLDRFQTPTTTDELVQRVIASLQGCDDVGSVGVGVPAPVRPDGFIGVVPNLPALRDLDLRSVLHDRLEVPVAIGNDANCAVIAECAFGAGRGARDVVLLTVGTGIGAGVVINGRLQTGATGRLGELGHLLIDPNGPECGCGQVGCWEATAAGPCLDALARVELGPQASGVDLFEAGASGSSAAMDAIRRYARLLAVGVRSIAAAFDPTVILLGGGVMESGDILLPLIAADLDAGPSGPLMAWPPLRLAELGNRAGAIGAALLGASIDGGDAVGPAARGRDAIREVFPST